MKYMFLIAGNLDAWNAMGDEESRTVYQRIAEWWGEQAAAGLAVEGRELQSSLTATTVRIATDGSTTVTDGPFVEGKEMVGGYGIFELPDLDAAIALASSWPAPDTIEIRPVVARDQ
jgi:hypothetical protein